MHTRVKELFEQLKRIYDYIIVDTAPAGLVADTLLLSNYGDYTLFVVRANYLDKRLLRIAETLHKEKRLPNISVLLNGSDHTKGYGYGYGYGYAYGGYGYGNEEIKPLWRKIFGFWKKKAAKI
jgi:Mrp family chromosome partitioning ATPase